uniref:Cation efflux protein cytoplasmic domain-containing protein n=1 Tax=Nothobranchius pienaari TaxID=704102 RepID=A0A1A8MJD7_9TELE
MTRSQWCMLGVITLLLLAQITTSQLCKSLITMVDAFHTLFILVHMVLPRPPTADIIKPPASPSHAASFLGEQPASASDVKHSDHEASTLFSSTTTSPTAPSCSLSFPGSRMQALGVFISALLLTSLCISYFLEIISQILDPHPVQLPLLPVAVGVAGLLCKVLPFVLNWDQLQDGRWAESFNQAEAGSRLRMSPKGQAGGASRGQGEAQTVVQSNIPAAHDSLHSVPLVLCNPGTSSIPDINCKNQQKQEILSEPEIRAAGFISESHSNTSCCDGHPDDPSTSSVCRSSPLPETSVRNSCRTLCLLSFVFVIRGLFTSVLALINSLVTLFIASQFLHCSAASSILVYLDPGLSLLAVVSLIAAAAPQVYRLGLLLLQASPPHVSVSDLRRRIVDVPGVQNVHDLHIWQLTESLVVASVHVHCYAGLPVHRFADLMSGITKVLQNVGVSCCTIQPEFTTSGSPSCSEGNPKRNTCPSPPLPTCSLACRRACAAHMCCSLLEEKWSLLRPSAVETRDEPQNLVIENTFL